MRSMSLPGVDQQVVALILCFNAVACTGAVQGVRGNGDGGSVTNATASPDGGRIQADSAAPAAADSGPSAPDAAVMLTDASRLPTDSGTSLLPVDAGATPSSPDSVAHVIFDSDMSSDWDDVGDIAVLHGLASLGRLEILAMAVSSLNGATALCMDAINTYYGKPDIAIGVRPDVGGLGGYPAQIASEFPHGPEKAPGDFPLAVDVYRKVLAGQPDKSVTIVTTGYLTNLKALLLSGPDQHSPLTGRELVRQKVRLFSCAGGAFPSGDEFNFRASGDDSAYVVLNDWPSQLVYVGYDVGQAVYTAGRLRAAAADSPIRRVYVDIENQIPYPSWGQIAVYYAARSAEGLWGAVSMGRNNLDMTGHNVWTATPDPSGDLDQSYLLEKARSPAREALDALIMLRPNDGSPSLPGDPSNLRATVAGGGRVELQWTDNSFNEAGFTIERKIDGTYTSIGTVAANVTRVADTGLPSTANLAYRVKATNGAGGSLYSNLWIYSSWTEINFSEPGNLPLYAYTQFNNLRWDRGGDFRPDHVTVNDDSSHGPDVRVDVDVGALGSEGAFRVYLFYRDPSNWYRLTVDGASSKFERKIEGTITQIGAGAGGVNIGNGSALSHWEIAATRGGDLSFRADGAVVLAVSEPLMLTSGKVGLGGVARTPVWESFHFETSP